MESLICIELIVPVCAPAGRQGEKPITSFDIVAGLLLGTLLGIVNALVLRAGVRLALKSGRRARALLIIACSYALRYILVAAIIYVIIQQGRPAMAIAILGSLGLFTMLWSLAAHWRKGSAGRGGADGKIRF